jgi:formylglycine-generating enzyme required for sulfatase activity
VIKGPAQRLEGTPRAFSIQDSLVDALLGDIDAGGAKDALPLLAFTIGRLYTEYHAGGTLKLSHYNELGGVKGSIEAAIERAFRSADADAAIPKDRGARLALLRRGLIPWLAGIDPETGALRRRVARLSEIPEESRPLIQHLVEQRLLATDVAKNTAEKTIEPAHEAVLRQWGLLQGWLTEDAGLLAVLEGVKRASRDWAANAKSTAWLVHSTDRLVAAERLKDRPDLSANLEPTDRTYLAECRKAEADTTYRKRRAQSVIYVLLIGIIASLIGWINQSYIREVWTWYWNVRPFIDAKIKPNVLNSAAEKALRPKDTFKECASEQGKDYCPEMVVVPAGSFIMGSPATEQNHRDNEGPQHNVTIAAPFAVSRFELTFDEWDTCVKYGDCGEGVSDNGFGRGQLPAVNLTWHDAQRYAAWLSRVTERPYRLLTDAEFEYAARGGTQTVYPWGDELGKNNANCYDCGSEWSNRQTAPVGSFAANGFGLHDMVGNVFEWVEDCEHPNYEGAPNDGSAWTTGCTSERRRVVRGGSFNRGSFFLRSAKRHANNTIDRFGGSGFRVARTLGP